MEESLTRDIFNYQDNHWFFAAKKMFFDALLGGIHAGGEGKSVLDLGCGTGSLISYLGRFGKVYGMDMSETALGYAVKTKTGVEHKFFMGEASRVPLKDNSVDMVCVSDVLYHKSVDDDQTVVDEAARVLKPNGILLLSDSAFKVLASSHDRASHAKRRYTAKEIRGKLQSGGFNIKRLSYTYCALFPAALAVRALRNIFSDKSVAGSDFKPIPAGLNSLINGIFGVEAFILRFMDMPFGVSCMAVAVKK